MYFRVTIPALQDGKRDEAVSYVKEKVMPEFTGTPGLLTMMAAITGENSGINLSCYDSKESLDAVQEKIQGVLSCLLYTSPSPRDLSTSRMPSSA